MYFEIPLKLVLSIQTVFLDTQFVIFSPTGSSDHPQRREEALLRPVRQAVRLQDVAGAAHQVFARGRETLRVPALRQVLQSERKPAGKLLQKKPLELR